jgi:hypothetical protein
MNFVLSRPITDDFHSKLCSPIYCRLQDQVDTKTSVQTRMIISEKIGMPFYTMEHRLSDYILGNIYERI